MHTNLHTYSQSHTYSHSHTPYFICPHTYTHFICSCTSSVHTLHLFTHVHAFNLFTHTHTCIQMYTRTRTHTHTPSSVHTYAHSHTCIHMYTHTRSHTRTRTHTHPTSSVHQATKPSRLSSAIPNGFSYRFVFVLYCKKEAKRFSLESMLLHVSQHCDQVRGGVDERC